MGGYDIDRLPLRVARAEGELLESWLHRVAYRYGLHPRDMLSRLGIDVGPQRSPRLRSLLDGDAAATVASRLGVDSHDLMRSTGVAATLELLRTRHLTEFRQFHAYRRLAGTRWCPACLAAEGIWRQEWADPLVVFCPIHAVMLAHRCPGCEKVPYAGHVWMTSLDDAVTCPEFPSRPAGTSRYRRRCRQRLDQVLARPATSEDIAAQAFLLDLAERAADEPDALVRVCGVDARVGVVFEAVLEFAEQRLGTLIVPVPAQVTEATIEVVRASAAVLRSASLSEAYSLALEHGLVPEAGVLAAVGPGRPVKSENPRNPLITALQLDAVRGTFAAAIDLQFRMGADRPGYPLAWQNHDRFLHEADRLPPLPASWIPQTVWPGALDLPGAADLGLETPHGRAFVSMCLARYGRAQQWREIATVLGLPSGSARKIQATWHRICAAGARDAFLQAIDQLFGQLHACPPPIDYAARRVRVWDAGRLDDGMLTKLPGRAHDTSDLPGLRRTFWALYTGGAELFAPPSYQQPDQPSRQEDPGLEASDVGVHLPSRFRDGPLTWMPP